ncbi:MAG: TetR/AcrR family transcriptional regulator [Shimia sp.]
MADGGDLAKRQYHHGDLRAGLVEATRRIVDAQGAEHVSMSAACRAAGVSTAAPYKHFKNKEELLEAVTFEAMERQRAALLELMAETPAEGLHRIEALGHFYVDRAIEEPHMFKLMFGHTEAHGGSEALTCKGAEIFEIVRSEVGRVLDQHAEAPEVWRRALMLWSFVHGLSFLMIDGKMDSIAGALDRDAFLADAGRRVMTG